MRKVVLAAASVVLSLGVAELVLRGTGFTPWRPSELELRVEPTGRLYRAHPTLGYALIPGRQSILFPTGLRFEVEHDSEGHRRTRPAPHSGLDSDVAHEPGRPEVWIFGGSFTYGWAIDDAESFPWRLQQKLPGRRVRNFAVPGYGTLQALIEFEERLRAQPAPEVAVIGYASFHDVRNTFARKRRKRVAPHNKLGPLVQPYARVGPNGELHREMARVDFTPWPGMRRSALVHLLESRWNEFEQRRLDEVAVTEAILLEIRAVAKRAGSRLLVATLTAAPRSDETRAFAKLHAIEAVDLGIDLNRPGYRNTPHDTHPSGRATAEYAELLARALRLER